MPIVGIKVDSEYLTACARIRNITLTTLVRELVQAIDQDQLVGAVLDDDGKRIRERYRHRYHAGRNQHAAARLAD